MCCVVTLPFEGLEQLNILFSLYLVSCFGVTLFLNLGDFITHITNIEKGNFTSAVRSRFSKMFLEMSFYNYD